MCALQPGTAVDHSRRHRLSSDGSEGHEGSHEAQGDEALWAKNICRALGVGYDLLLALCASLTDMVI